MTTKGTANARGVLIVDDHPVVREGVTRLIDRQPDLYVCGQCDEPHEAVLATAQHAPRVAVCDLMLRRGSGLELVKQLAEHPVAPSVVVLSMHDESMYAERALRAGARAYVMKQDPPERLIAAIRCVLEGGIFLSEVTKVALLGSMVGAKAKAKSPLERLTDREMEVFERIGGGDGMQEIADRLSLSAKTVEAHREHIKQKLNLTSSRELQQYAVRYSIEQSLAK